MCGGRGRAGSSASRCEVQDWFRVEEEVRNDAREEEVGGALAGWQRVGREQALDEKEAVAGEGGGEKGRRRNGSKSRGACRP